MEEGKTYIYLQCGTDHETCLFCWRLTFTAVQISILHVPQSFSCRFSAARFPNYSNPVLPLSPENCGMSRLDPHRQRCCSAHHLCLTPLFSASRLRMYISSWKRTRHQQQLILTNRTLVVWWVHGQTLVLFLLCFYVSHKMSQCC